MNPTGCFLKCKNQEWCTCKGMISLYNSTMSKFNQCHCCVFRAQTLDEFLRIEQKEHQTKTKRKQLQEAIKESHEAITKND